MEPGRTIRGAVLTADGAPAAGAEVTCRPAWQPPSQWGPFGDGIRQARTGDDGLFAFDGLAADGIYLLRAERSFPEEHADRRCGRDDPAGDVVLAFAETASLRVRVVDAVRREVSEAEVDCFRQPEGAFLESFQSLANPLRLAPGAYRIALADDIVYPPSGVDVVLTAGERGTCTIRREANVFAGRVVDLAGAPVFGADVYLDSMSEPSQSAEARTDESGAFRVEGLASGRWRLRIMSPRNVQLDGRVDVPADARVWTVAPDCTARVLLPPEANGRPVNVNCDAEALPGGDEPWELSVAATSVPAYGAGDEPLEVAVETAGRLRFRIHVHGYATTLVEMPPARGADFDVVVPALVRGVEVAGRVVDPEGVPVAGVRVAIVDAGDNRPDVVTEPSGHFRTQPLTPGPVTLSVGARGGLLHRTVHTEARADSAPVEIVLSRGGIVDILSTDASGAPVPDHDFEIRDANGDPSATGIRSDHRGRARMRLNPGVHTVATAGAETATIDVTEGGQHALRIVVR